MDEPLLKRQLLRVRGDPRALAIIGCGQELRGTAPTGRYIGGDRRERLTSPQAPRARHMQCQILVAEDKPVLFAQRDRRLHQVARVAGHAPAIDRIDAARQRVEHRVEIRRDAQPPVLAVVTDVADHRQLARRQRLMQRQRHAGTTNTTGN